MTKKCFRCGNEKDVSLFYKHGGMADGYLGKCIECTKSDARRFRSENIEEVKEYDRNRKNKQKRTYQNKERIARLKKEDPEKYRKQVTEAKNNYRKRYKEKSLAHSRLMYAVYSGKIVNPKKCEKCGKECIPEAHHEDYSKPLDINWLCDECHKKRHVEIRSEKRRSVNV